jgi:hypothetical protein
VKYCQSDRVKKGEMDGTVSGTREMRMGRKLLLGSPKGCDHSEDLGVVGRKY